MNWFCRFEREQKCSLGSIIQEYEKDQKKPYILKAKGGQIHLIGHNLKQIKSTYRNADKSKGSMNVFTNITSKFKSKNSRQNKSPLRSRQNRNQNSAISKPFKPNQFKGIPKIQSKVAEKSQNIKNTHKKNSCLQKTTKKQLIKQHQTVSDIIPKTLDLSFQNMHCNLSELTKKQDIFCNEDERNIPSIVILPVKQKDQEMNDKEWKGNPRVEDNKGFGENKQEQRGRLKNETDSEIQRLKNPYAECDDKQLQKTIKKSSASHELQQDISPSGDKDIGIDDLDINNLIQIGEDSSNSPIKLIEHYHTDFNLKDSIRPKPAMSQVYEVPKLP